MSKQTQTEMPEAMQLSQERPWLKTLTGTQIRIKTAGAETDNRVTVIEYVEPPHSKPPIFTRHEFIEVFCVLHGVLTFQFLGEQPFAIGEGQNVTCPSWKPHSFWNETEHPVTALLVCTPAGLDEFFVQSNKLLETATDAIGVSLPDAMKELRTKYGLEHVGEPPVQIPSL